MDVLLCADTLRSAHLRHEIPAAIMDEIVYAESGGRAYVAGSILERTDVLRARPEIEFVDVNELGVDELLARGVSWDEMIAHVALRLCGRIGLTRAAVPFGFPAGVWEIVRAGGVDLEVDGRLFDARRRVKNAAELAGVRRACRA
ncbi:MAG TPA: hypothetical protein VN238_18030, partial [Solirubrobacteraceae bacterium]|nr:hypothetical protein [Solirubrobacteraceae bacterium]